ncbi:MAG: hypothetical protein R2797_12840 [Gelidibacter sp.]
MKSILLFLVFILSSFSSVNSQTVEGTYTNKWVASSGEGISYTLVLKDNGQFTFSSTRFFMDSTADKTVKADGTWSLDGHLLILDTQTNDKNSEGLISNLNQNKARYVSVSPRNPNFNLVKPSLKFYESDVFYAKDMELFKTEDQVTTLEQ